MFYGFYLYAKNCLVYNRLNNTGRFKVLYLESRPNLYDRFDVGGSVSKHYFHQDLWAARKIYDKLPSVHYDIGSRLDGFISHCLVYTKVIMLDIRPIKQSIGSLEFIQTNAMNMSNVDSNSIDSISSLHAVEHFGLVPELCG